MKHRSLTIRLPNLQEIIAIAFSLMFLTIFIATASHFHVEIASIFARSVDARQQLVNMTKAMEKSAPNGDVLNIDSDIDALVREKNKLQDRIEVHQAELIQNQSRMEDSIRSARNSSLLGAGPWYPGPEPDLAFKGIRPEWIEWDAKKKLCESANEEYWKNYSQILLCKVEFGALKRQLDDVIPQINKVRELKNEALATMRDPAKLRKLQNEAKGSWTTSLLIVIIHFPLGLYSALLFVKFLFRFALMREWLVKFRLEHAR